MNSYGELIYRTVVNDGTIAIASIIVACVLCYLISEAFVAVVIRHNRRVQDERNARWEELKGNPAYSALLDPDGDVIAIIDLQAIEADLKKRQANSTEGNV